MITCQHCNTRNHDGAIFCDECGRELATTQWSTSPTAPPQINTPRATMAPIQALRMTPHATPTAPSQAPMPQAQPIIKLSMPNGQRFTLAGKDDYTIGRDERAPGDLDIDLAKWDGFKAGVSRHHFSIHTRTDGVFVEDLESRNLTVQNGYRLLPQQWYPLHDGDELKLGAITLYVSFERP